MDNFNLNFLVSIIFGLGLSTLFRKVCNGNECLVIRVDKVENKIFRINGKCFKFELI